MTRGAPDTAASDLLAELHRQHYIPLVRLAALLLGDVGASEEVVQEAFVKVFRSVDRIRDLDKAPAYLRSAVLNGARSRLARPRVTARLAAVARADRVCTVRRMPRVQVYLPEELYAAMKDRGLPASQLLQDAVKAEVRRQELDEEAERYVTELIAEVGEPSAREQARAAAVARRIRDRAAAVAG